MKPIINLEFIHQCFDDNPEYNVLQFDGTCEKCCCETSLVVKLVPGEDGNGAFEITGGAMRKHGGMMCETCWGEHGKTEVYTRVVGYLRPRDQMHKSKQKEVSDRKMFDLSIV